MSITTHSDGRVKLNVLQGSPLDERRDAWKSDASAQETQIQHWVASRYNVRATADDGQLILWNTLSGAMSVFTREQAPSIVALLKGKGFHSRKVGLAGYLAERGFLVPKGTNEYRRFLHLFGKQHYRSDLLELILMTSEDCNFRCKYCYEHFARGTMLPEVRQGIRRLIEKRIEHLGALNVSFFGGEPLYGWPAVEELGPFLREITERHGVAYGTHMTTNGYLLTPERAGKLLAWNIRNFQITLDGSPENHDCNRPARDGSGTFWTILDNLESLSRRSEPFRVSLRVNFDKTNVGRMDELLELVETTLRRDERFHLDFHAVGQWGGPNDSQLEVCGADEQKRFVAQMKAIAHARGLAVSTLRGATAMGSQVCYAARPYNLIIGASGQIMKCTVVLDTQDYNVVGRIRPDGELVLDDEKMALWTEPAFQRDEQCKKCVALPCCEGISCPLPRVTADARQCIATRTEGKAQLIETLAYSRKNARTRQVVTKA